METFKRQKGEPTEALTTRLIKDRAGGRCEFVWFEDLKQKRCTELHGEKAQSFAGIVSLIPMPVNGLLDRRVSSLKAYCQKHAYCLLAELGKAVAPKPPRGKKNNEQVDLFVGMGGG